MRVTQSIYTRHKKGQHLVHYQKKIQVVACYSKVLYKTQIKSQHYKWDYNPVVQRYAKTQ